MTLARSRCLGYVVGIPSTTHFNRPSLTGAERVHSSAASCPGPCYRREIHEFPKQPVTTKLGLRLPVGQEFECPWIHGKLPQSQ